jgi:Flp pilus assembly protein TadB
MRKEKKKMKMNKADREKFWREWWKYFKKSLEDEALILMIFGLSLIVLAIIKITEWGMIPLVLIMLIGVFMTALIPGGIFWVLRKKYKKKINKK